MRILFLYPNFYGMNMLPTGVGLLIRAATNAGHKTSVFDTTQYLGWFGEDNDEKKQAVLSVREYDPALIKQGDKLSSPIDDFQSHVSSFSPDLIALSMTEDMFNNGINILNSINWPDRPKVVAGGVFPTFAPELVLRKSNGLIDYVLIGEGERSLIQLCDALERKISLSDVEGLWRLKKDSVVKGRPPTLTDVNESPLLPDFDQFDESRFYRPMVGKVWRMFPIETARGCPYTCAYCNSPSQTTKFGDTKQHFFRKKSMRLVKKEIEHVISRYQADSIDFWADTFLAMSDYDFDEFIEMYSDIRLPFWIQNRTETVTEEKFKKLLDVGLMRVDFGIEHGNEQFRRKMLLRRVSNDSIVSKLDIVKDLGVSFATNNIVGFPMETRDLALETVELNRRIRSDGASITTFVPFHGTPLRTLSESLGYVQPGQIAQSIFNPTMLDMPQWNQKEISGFTRCFVLYIALPKSMWPEIEKAEQLTPEGDEVWEKLRQYTLENQLVWDYPSVKSDNETTTNIGPTADGHAIPLSENFSRGETVQ